MSHKATNWLSDLDADDLSNSEFRVLFHLCDCHNPSNGCFPTQKYLKKRTGVSNGTVNYALKSLEANGLIERNQAVCPHTHRQLPTRYILGFEMAEPQEPTPENGDGKVVEPTPNSGDGSDSNSDPVPTPKNGNSRLQPVGDKPVKKPVNNQDPDFRARWWADKIKGGAFVPASAISIQLAQHMLKLEVLTKDDLRTAGIPF